MTTLATCNAEHITQENDANNNSSSSPSANSAANGLAKTSRWQSATDSDQDGRNIPRFLFDPDSSIVCYWTTAVALATLYNAWMIALRIAFPEIRQENGPSYLAYMDILSDIIYLLDIIIQLRTAYLEDGIPVFDAAKIRHQYISQTYFIQDLISALPSQMILSLLPDAVGCCKYFLCTAGAARLTRLLKFHKLYKFYDLAESFTSNPHLIRVLRLFLNLAVIIHWIACLYYLLSEYEGLGSNSWVYTNSTDQQRFSRKYIICLYWSAMTLTTIGNTNPPETDLEYIFTGVIFLTGVFVFATVMGNVGDVISSMNANRQEFQARMDHIQMYLTHKKVPASLQMKIKKWAEYTWSRTKATDESRLLNMLPERLRAEVAVHVHLDSLKKVKIFEQCETGFLCELVLKLRSQVFSPGDYVCKAGETGREMFIINHGKVEVIVPNPANNKDMVVAVLSEGNYFGEISLLRLDGVQNRRTADVRSIGYSELLCLSRRDLMAALVEYPEAKSVLEVQAKKRMKTNLQAQRAFSVDTLLRSSQDYSSMDSGIVSKDERGHAVSEIKAMIEELKNANKVPGRTIWQLIARCEVLQAKVGEKEKEIEDSKQRIKDLEELLFSRFRPRHSETPEFTSNNTEASVQRHLRPLTNKVVKQFSQDEGRHIFRDKSESPTEIMPVLEQKTLPKVKITKPSSETSSTSDDFDTNIFQNNFIKTSKITNVYDKPAKCKVSIQSLHGKRNEQEAFTNLPVTVVKKYGSTFKTFVADDDEDNEVIDCGRDISVYAQNVLNMNPSNYSVSNEIFVDHEILLNDSDRLSLSARFKNEINLSDYAFDVNTIPEEDEEEMDNVTPTTSSSPYRPADSTPVESSYFGDEFAASDDVFSNTGQPSGHALNRDSTSKSHCYASGETEQTLEYDRGILQDTLGMNRLCSSLEGINLESLQPDVNGKLLRLNSVSSCFSDEPTSRRSSWNWDSESDSEEVTSS